MDLFSLTCLVSHICLAGLDRFFIAAVRSIEILPQNNGAHGKVIPRLGVPYSIGNKLGRQSNPPLTVREKN